MRSPKAFVLVALLGASSALPACDDGAGGEDNEVITTVTLTFTPVGGGAPVTAAFDDADGPGGDAPTMQPVDLADGTTYTMTVRFQNKLEDPPEEITDEVGDEGDEHILLFTGTAVNGPASDQPAAPLTHSYGDVDDGGLPIGLTNQIVAAAGTGTLTVTLRHLPPVNGTAVKTAELLTQAKEMGLASLPGSTDASVDFTTTVR